MNFPLSFRKKMNYGTFSTSVSASFGLYCQGLDKKKVQDYQEAIDLFSRALESLKDEYIEDERKTCRQEKILLQRASVHILNNNLTDAENDTSGLQRNIEIFSI